MQSQTEGDLIPCLAYIEFGATAGIWAFTLSAFLLNIENPSPLLMVPAIIGAFLCVDSLRQFITATRNTD